MSTIALTYQAVQRKITAVSLPSINWKALCVAMAAFVAVTLVLYVYQINALTGGTYLIKNYNKQLAALTEKNKQLEGQFAQMDFLSTAMSQAQVLNFQKITEVTYVQMPNNSLAQAK